VSEQGAGAPYGTGSQAAPGAASVSAVPVSIPSAEHPWRFKATVEGDLVHICATFDAAGVEAFRAKLIALRAVLDTPASAIEARSDATGTGAAEGESAGPKDDAQPQSGATHDRP
jgi:hypothetical protein